MLTWLRPRNLGWLGFYGVVLLAWVAVALMATENTMAGQGSIPAEFWAALCAGADQAAPIALWGMWALMATAMMLPTFVPAMRTFTDLGAAGATDRAGVAALVAGYLAVWLGASVIGAAAQWTLARKGVLTPGGASLSPWLTAMLLVGAGAYQFTTLKESCLAKCRMPLTYFMEHWRPGTPAAFTMGLHLGALCLGCCWALMALGFVGGVMNLIWMGAATLFMTLEKLPDIGRPLTRPAGMALIAAGGIVSLRALHFN
jgi:predicted metal-binding membrane protein